MLILNVVILWDGRRDEWTENNRRIGLFLIILLITEAYTSIIVGFRLPFVICRLRSVT